MVLIEYQARKKLNAIAHEAYASWHNEGTKEG